MKKEIIAFSIIAILLIATAGVTIIFNAQTIFFPERENKTNHPPFVSASADKTCGKSPLTVSFTGEGYDIDGDRLSYRWDFGDGSSATIQNPQHSYKKEGKYFANLTVTDDYGNTESETIEINVLGNYPPIANISVNPAVGLRPLKVHFSGENSRDPDGEIVSYHWVFEGLLFNSESDEPNLTCTYIRPDVYKVTLTVCDDDGATDTAETSIWVIAPVAGFLKFLAELYVLHYFLHDVLPNQLNTWNNIN